MSQEEIRASVEEIRKRMRGYKDPFGEQSQQDASADDIVTLLEFIDMLERQQLVGEMFPVQGA